MIVVFGANGMLGRELMALAGPAARGLTRAEIDLADPSCAPEKWLEGASAVINATAYTKVDAAETETAVNHRMNAEVPGELARACQAAGVRFLHFSTDYVFPGTATKPIPEDAECEPINAYGAAKRLGEEAVLGTGGHVMRTSWLFGAHGPCFPKTMLRLAKERGALRVVADQVGCPTAAADLASVALRYLQNPPPGPQMLHAVGPEAMDWCTFAGRCLSAFRAVSPGDLGEVPIDGIRTEEFPTPAMRPAYSVLATTRLDALGLTPMRPLEQSLRDFWRQTNSPS